MTHGSDRARRENAELRAHIQKLEEQVMVLQRIAVILLHRPPNNDMARIRDEEWLAAAGADMQWRTVRPPVVMSGPSGLVPEIHVACTLHDSPHTPLQTPEVKLNALAPAPKTPPN